MNNVITVPAITVIDLLIRTPLLYMIPETLTDSEFTEEHAS